MTKKAVAEINLTKCVSSAALTKLRAARMMSGISPAQKKSLATSLPRCVHIEGTSMSYANVAVIGDSVPWGQGLLEEHKFVSAIATTLGCPTKPQMVAHSGAIIGANYQGAQVVANPEIPIGTPTICAQLDKIANPAQVDLVLINGGINDVSLQVILNPFVSSSDLQCRTWKACYTDMKTLLQRVLGTFTNPNCRFLVLGYYPILSSDSELVRLPGDPLIFFLGLHGLSLHPLIDQPAMRNRFASQAMQFLKDSDIAIQQAVSEIAKDGTGNRLTFLPTPFGEENALFASDPYLFGFDEVLRPQDEVRGNRATACNLFYPNPVDGANCLICQYASVGHPNRKGSDMIAKAIAKVL